MSLNLYTYVHNNPLTNIDPTGHYCVSSDGNWAHSGGCSDSSSTYVDDKYTEGLNLPRIEDGYLVGYTESSGAYLPVKMTYDQWRSGQPTLYNNNQPDQYGWMQTGFELASDVIAAFMTDGFSLEVKAASQAATAGSKLPSLINPLEGIEYTGKVQNQMLKGPGEYHSFPLEVDKYGNYGNVFKKTGGDGVERTWVEIPGTYNKKDGVFQYIIEPDGKTVNHRKFEPYRQK